MQVTFKNKPEDIAVILRGLPWRDFLMGYFQGYQVLHAFWPPALMVVLLQDWYVLNLLLFFPVTIFIIHTFRFFRVWLTASRSAKVVQGEMVMKLEEEYLEVRSERGVGRRPWKHVDRILDAPDFLVFFVGPLRAHVIPKHFFDSSAEAEQFAQRAQQLYQAAQTKPVPEFQWETFARDFGLDQLHLIRYLKWDIDPRICARIETQGIDRDGKIIVPTFWSLCMQTIFPGLLTILLMVSKWSDLGGGNPLYYVVMIMAIVFWALFGLQLNTYLRFRSALARQRTFIQPDQAWFFAEGVGTVTAEGARYSRWTILEEIANDREAIVLFDFAPYIYMTIPKASFESPEEEEFIRERMEECHDIEHNAGSDAVVAEEDEVIVADLVDNPYRSPPPR